MEMTGIVIAVLPERSGVSQRGEWKSQSFVIETQEQYPKKMAFDVFGADRIAQFNIQGGELITVQFDIDAHECQGRWFNSIRAWNVTHPDQQAVAQGGYNMNPQAGAQAAQQAQQTGVPNPTSSNDLFTPTQQPAQPQENSDDLPF